MNFLDILEISSVSDFQDLASLLNRCSAVRRFVFVVRAVMRPSSGLGEAMARRSGERLAQFYHGTRLFPQSGNAYRGHLMSGTRTGVIIGLPTEKCTAAQSGSEPASWPEKKHAFLGQYRISRTFKLLILGIRSPQPQLEA